jgi:hypothetical protein
MKVLRREWNDKYIEREMMEREEYRIELIQPPSRNDEGVFIIYYLVSCCERDAVERAMDLWIENGDTSYRKRRRRLVRLDSISSNEYQKENKNEAV